jgi:fructokinase
MPPYARVVALVSCSLAGAPANVAIVISRLGGWVAFVGKLGDDEFGRMLAAILHDNSANGEREFMFYRNPSVV